MQIREGKESIRGEEMNKAHVVMPCGCIRYLFGWVRCAKHEMPYKAVVYQQKKEAGK